MKACKITPRLNQPRCATITGGEVQATLDQYEPGPYFHRPAILDWTYADIGEAMVEWTANYKGNDPDGVGYDFAIEQIEVGCQTIEELKALQGAEREASV